MSEDVRPEVKDRIVGALETIVQALLGNVLETMRLSVSELGVETERRIEGLRQETRGSLDALRVELQSSDEAIKQEASSAVETRAGSMTKDFESRLGAAKRELEAKLDEIANRLQGEHLALSERLDGTERGLVGQEKTSGRISEVLDALGHALVREAAQPPGVAVAPPPAEAPVQSSNPEPQAGVSDLESMFDELRQPSEIDTQPVSTEPGLLLDKGEVEDALGRVELLAPKRK